MAKIALRVYTREIEELIEHGQFDESIAHCRHILKAFPKHIEAYRLLGKAYLEGKRYGDAADIFQRVLSSVPDDFVSHVGMSIIREDEGNLDAAIWHMQRAFEDQPSTQAIQDELRRLYGRRDGLEPPKIRLTRGALSRMYAHGDLHEQAIAELNAALAEDPQRPDLQVLLAEMYYQAGKLVDAAEACRHLLDKLPYCLTANRILALIVKDGEQDGQKAAYQEHVKELDPYAGFITEDIPDPINVPDKAIVIERLQWRPGQPEDEKQPAWAASLGIDFGNEEREGEAIPDWLSPSEEPKAEDFSPKPKQAEVSSQAEEEADGDEGEAAAGELDRAADEELESEEIPDWTDDFELEQPDPELAAAAAPIFGGEETNDDDEDVPDWLQNAERESDDYGDFNQEQNQEEVPDWVKQVDTGQLKPPGPEDEEVEKVPEWLKDIRADSPPSQPEEKSQDEVPDWVKNADTGELSPPTPEASSTDDTPGWLQELGDEKAELEAEYSSRDEEDEEIRLQDLEEQEPAAPAEDIPGLLPDSEDDTPDWMKELDPEAPSPAADEPDLLESLMEQDNQAAAPQDKAGVQDPAEDWLSELAGEAQPEDDSPDWLQDLGKPADTPAPDEMPSDLPAASATPTVWPPEETEDVQEQEPGEMIPSNLDDEDDAMAWLEGLAAKQGVNEEELVTQPEKRSSDAPSWIQDVSEDMQVHSDAEPEVGETPEQAGEPPDILETPEQPEDQEMSETEQPTEDDTPDWLKSAMGEAGPQLPAESKEDFIEENDDWLSELAAKSELEDEIEDEIEDDEVQEDQEFIDPAAAESPQQETPAQEAEAESLEEDALNWLDNLEAEVDSLADNQPAPAEQQDSDWLDDLDTDALRIEDQQTEDQPVEDRPLETSASDDSSDDSMDWLREMGAESAETEQEEFEADSDEVEQPEWLPEANAPLDTPAPSPEREENDVSEPAQLAHELEESVEDVIEESQELTEELQESVEDVARESGELARKLEESKQWVNELLEEKSAGEQEAPLSEPGGPPVSESKPKPAKKSNAKKERDKEADRLLTRARADLNSGKLETATETYGRLVRKNKHLDEVIGDIRAALIRHPVDVLLWQALGDAYMKSDRLQDALDTYTKAEELLR